MRYVDYQSLWSNYILNYSYIEIDISMLNKVRMAYVAFIIM